MFELTINRNFNVSVDTLFKAWCDPKLLQKWFAPGNMTVPQASANVKKGGSYLIVMHDGDSKTDHIIGGKYQEVVNNERLVFTWQWQGNPVATKVKVLFTALTDNTSTLTLTHSEFVSQEECDKHNMGWIGCLNNLPKALAN